MSDRLRITKKQFLADLDEAAQSAAKAFSGCQPGGPPRKWTYDVHGKIPSGEFILPHEYTIRKAEVSEIESLELNPETGIYEPKQNTQ